MAEGIRSGGEDNRTTRWFHTKPKKSYERASFAVYFCIPDIQCLLDIHPVRSMLSICYANS